MRLFLALIACLSLAASFAAPALGNGFEGTVSGPSGPVGEVEVCIVEVQPSETCVYSGDDGNYKMPGLEAGVYQVEFLPSYASHLVAQYYDHKAKLSEANRVLITPKPKGEESKLLEGIDAQLELGGEIEGRVTSLLGGQNLEGVEVCAQDAVTASPVSCSHTDAEGNYALPSVPPGSYRVGFWGEGPSADYAPQYYDEKLSFFEATNIAVSAGATITDIDAKLQIGAQVSGIVSNVSGGLPLTGIAVCLLRGSASGPERCAYTNSSGRYTFPGLAGDTYKIVFSPEFNEFANGEFVLPEEDGWHTQYYAGSTTREGATALQLAVSESRSDVDAELSTTHVALPPPPPAPTPDALVSVPPIVTAPPANSKKCRKGFKKVKTKGKARCVKKTHKRHKKKSKKKS